MVPGSDDPGFGIYFHWPFCAAKCPYCDFNSHVRHGKIDQDRYARAFVAELRNMRCRVQSPVVTSIFFGGGTPSLMEPAALGTILDTVLTEWTVDPDVEITLEANPTSAEAERFKAYRLAGINRLSLGVQSLDDAALRLLGRRHSAREAAASIELARRSFPRLSFDLIYARPRQTLQSWEAELNKAIDLAADHLSLYQLTIEEGTIFHHLHRQGKLDMPDDDHCAELYKLTGMITEEKGLPAYEISNHARPGAESRHNLTYWRYGQYVGVGPGAHGRFIENGRRVVTVAEKLPERWLGMVESTGSAGADAEILSAEQQADELLLMGLRLREGVDIGRCEGLRGRPLDERRIANLCRDGLLARDCKGRLAATPAGALLLNSLVAELAA